MRLGLVCEPAGDVFGPVGEDDAGAGAGDCGERFEGDGALVDPALLGGGFDHGIFAGDVVGGEGDPGKAIADEAYDVEIGEGGLDHDEVGPFSQVEFDFTEGLLGGGGGVHLVGAAVAEFRSTFGGFAEGSVKAAGVFGGV